MASNAYCTIAHFQKEWPTGARMAVRSIVGSFGGTIARAKNFSLALLLLREQKICARAMGLMHITSQFFSSSAAYCMKSRLGGIA